MVMARSGWHMGRQQFDEQYPNLKSAKEKKNNIISESITKFQYHVYCYRSQETHKSKELNHNVFNIQNPIQYL